MADGSINYDEVNSEQLDNYLRLDISAIYNAKIGNKTGLQAGISVWNLLNRENLINTFYRIDNTNNAQQILQQSLGITPNASLKILLY